MNPREMYEAVMGKLAALTGVQGRGAQRERNFLRKEANQMEGLPKSKRGTTNVPGAFGSGIEFPVDPRPALKPAEMRKHAQELAAART